MRWHSSEPELLSSAGSVDTEIKRVHEVMLQAELSAGDYRADFELPVTLVPEVLTPEEQQKKKFSEELSGWTAAEICGISGTSSRVSGKDIILPECGKT